MNLPFDCTEIWYRVEAHCSVSLTAAPSCFQQRNSKTEIYLLSRKQTQLVTNLAYQIP